MTVRQELAKRLMDMGMFESQALEVLKLAEPKLNEVLKDNSIALDMDGGYDGSVYRVLISFIKPIALKWIKEKMPMAWYKPMFA